MFKLSSTARRKVAAVLAIILTIQPAFAGMHEYRIPLVNEKPVKPPVPPKPTQPPKPGAGEGEVDTGDDPEAARKPVLSVMPASLQFESNPNISPVSRSSIITNVGPVPTLVSGLDSNEHFTVSHNCPDSLEIDATCTVTVTPTSAAPGTVKYTLGVIAPGAEEQKSIELSTFERSAGLPYPRLVLSEDVVFLGDLKPGEHAQGSAKLTNTGTAPALLSGITSSKYFAVTHDCPDELIPMASCNISAAFQAYDAKSYQHTLLLKTGEVGELATPLTFYAAIKGNPALRPALAFDVAQLMFGPIDPGTAATKKLVLSNRGTAPAELLDLVGTKDFDVSTNCPALLNEGTSCNVTVTFNAKVAGSAPGYSLIAKAQDDIQTIALLSGQVTGTGSPETPTPALIFEPSGLSFGNVAVGQSTTATAKLTNNGTLAANLSSLTVDAGSHVYRMKHTCGVSLEPNTSCDMTVTFTPSHPAALPGRINATLSTGQSSALMLDGTGQQALLSVGPTTVDMGATIKLTPTGYRSVYLSNSGNVPLTGLNLVNKDSRLNVDPGTCTTVLEPNKGCSINIQYSPDALGTFAGDFQVTSDNGGAAKVAWSGMAVHLEATPSALVFPATRVGSSAPDQSFQLTNHGPASVPFDGVGVVDGRYYFGQSNNCDKALAAGASCTVSVRFTPTYAQQYQGSVDVAVRGTVTNRVRLSGEGSAPQLSLSSTALRFPDTNVGETSAVLSLVISNATSELATLTGISLSQGDTEFAQTNDCGKQLQPNSTCTVNLQMKPATVEGSAGTLSIVSSFGTQNVNLSGRGTEPAGGVDEPITPPGTGTGGTGTPGSEYDGYTQYTINFLDTEVSKSSAIRNVKFTNRGDGLLTVKALSIVKGMADYGQTNDCGEVLAPGAYCTISLLFTPSALGDRLGGIALTSDGGNFFFNLKGKGIGAEGSWRADSSADFGVVAVNTKAVRSFTLTNVGTVKANAIEAEVKGDSVRVTANTCGAPGATVALGVGASCRVSVEYAPTVSGELSATLQATGSLANGPVTLALKGSSPPPAMIFDAAPTGDFGTITVGTNTSRTYYLRNTGKLTDSVGSLTMEGSGFSINGGTCKVGLELSPSNQCTVTVTANPPAVGPQTGTLRVVSTQGAKTALPLTANAIQSDYVISGSGTATTAPAPAFGLVTAGSRTVNRLFFLRDSEKIATLSADRISVSSDGSFKLVNIYRVDANGYGAGSCPTSAIESTAPCAAAAPGHAIAVEVQFAPMTVGEKSAVLRFEHNGASRVSQITLSGAGEFNPNAAWSTTGRSLVPPTAANLSYGVLTPGTNAEKEFFLRNVGTHGAQSIGLKLSGDVSHFRITRMARAYQAHEKYLDSCMGGTGQIAAGGGSTTPCRAEDPTASSFTYPGVYFSIQYVPASTGKHSVTVTPVTDNGTTLPAPIVLSGEALFNPTAVWSSTGNSVVAPSAAHLFLGTLTQGTSAERGVHLRNVGSNGAQSVGFKLSGDVSQFKIVRVAKAYQASDMYVDNCPTSTGQIAAGGASSSPCLADDIAFKGFSYAGVYLAIRYTPTEVGSHSVTVTPTTNNGTVLPDPITFTGASQFNPTAVWSTDGSRVTAFTDVSRHFGTRTTGSFIEKSVYLRNTGTHGNLAVGVKLSGDTSQFRVVSIQKSYQGANGYHENCSVPASQISSDGSTTTPCITDDIARSGFNYSGVHVLIRYTPTVVGNHSVTITPATNNGTTIPEPLVLTGAGAFNATGVWSSTATATTVPTTAYLSFGSRAPGTTLDKLVFVRNTGTYGGQAVGFTLSGDTSHFKLVQVSKVSQVYNNYTEACSPASTIGAGGLTATPCLAADVTTGGMSLFGVQFTLRYAPTAPGNHTVTVTPTTNNGTRLPEPIVFTGSAP